MKQAYSTPTLELDRFITEDIITLSTHDKEIVDEETQMMLPVIDAGSLTYK